MKTLALETSTDACSVALLTDDSCEQIYEVAPRQHGKFLLPWIESLLTAQEINFQELDVLSFGSGPGSFTGLRIACGVIQGLSLAKNIPIIPISSFRTLAQAVSEKNDKRPVLICQDARMNEVYYSGYEYNSETELMEAVIPEALCKPEQISFPTDKDWIVVGDGWKLYFAIKAEEVYPEAMQVAKIARKLFHAGIRFSAEEVFPAYLRQTDSWKKIDQQ